MDRRLQQHNTTQKASKTYSLKEEGVCVCVSERERERRAERSRDLVTRRKERNGYAHLGRFGDGGREKWEKGTKKKGSSERERERNK